MPNITVLDDAGLAALGEAALDVVVVVSVIQYVPRSGLPELARDWRRRLRSGGTLIVADIIPPDVGMVADIRSLLVTASAHGFLLAALAGLVAAFFSDYRRLRQNLGFAVYGEAEIEALLKAARFAPALQARNLGFHPARRTVIARAV